MADTKKARIEERERNTRIGSDLVFRNAKRSLVIYSCYDGTFCYRTNDRTWALGALRRVTITLEERERLDVGEGEND